MKDDGDLLDLLVQKLRWLKLPGMVKQATSLLELAAKDNLSTLLAPALEEELAAILAHAA